MNLFKLIINLLIIFYLLLILIKNNIIIQINLIFLKVNLSLWLIIFFSFVIGILITVFNYIKTLHIKNQQLKKFKKIFDTEAKENSKNEKK